MIVAFPNDPEDTRYELYLSTLGWVDVTSDVYNRDGVQVTRGYTSERTDGAAQPQSCQLTLMNHTGKYSPRNPLGAYYGKFGQNTPLRVSTVVTKDSFDRTVVNEWGQTDEGDDYYLYWSGGGIADFDVTAGKGTHTIGGTVQYRISTLQGTRFRDVEIRATVSLPFTNVTGGNVEPANLIVGGQDVGGAGATDYFMLELLITTAEAITVRLLHVSGFEIAPLRTLAFAHTGVPLRVAFQTEGQTLRAKVWRAADPEPYAWTIEGGFNYDEFIDRAPGWVGIRSGVSGGNTNIPVVFSYDDVEVRVNRFHGEVASWPSQWDTSGNDVYVPIEAAGIRRRLSQGQAPLVSTMRRGNQTATFSSDPGAPPHVLYYPIEDESGSTSIASGLPNIGPMQISGGGTPQLAADSSYPGSAPFGKPNNSRWSSPVISTPATGTVQLMMLLSVPSTGETDLATFSQLGCTGSIGFVDCFYHSGSGGGLELRFYDQGRAAITSSGTIPANVNGRPMVISIELVQNGGNVDWTLAWWPKGASGGTAFFGTVPVRSIGAPRQLLLSPYTQVSSSALGHAAVRTSLISIFSLNDQLNAYAGEGAITRVERLCLENDAISLSFIRSSILDGAKVGTQGRKNLLDLLDECAKADLGYLNESRDILGLVFRYGRSLYNQDAVLTLDYADGQVQSPFGQVDDDLLLTNDFTAKRTNGSSYRATQETGPLAVTSPTSGAGVGRYVDEQEYNVATDDQLTDIATWKVHLGTVDEPRYPRVTVNLAKLALVSKQLYVDALSVNLQDRIEIINPKELVINGTISQIVPGYTEKLASKEHEITFVCVPGVPYEVAEAASDTGDTNQWVFRADTDSSTVNTTAAAGATSLSVATPAGPLWTTVADDFPLYLDVGGIKVRATACSGASSPQTFTVDALPVARAAGLSVSVWHLPVLAL
ncbi:hypothetical protein ACFWIW_10635 [Amycolatopsis sp. NPDC058340]|uniref:hypothetical protein n=1 Tax=Amycolatopsis sp. NPDC058340 TaxID=3346453 RepID=UPI003660C05D